MNSISCRLLLFPAAADLMADGILQIFSDARSLAFLTFAPLALVLADARSLAFLALASCALVLADARSLAFLASVSYALVLADARSLACMSSTLLHLIALLFAVRAGAWKACACIPCAACAASETDCLLGSCLLFLSALLFLQQQHLLSSVAFSCCCRSHGRWHIANLLFMSSTLLHLIALLFAVQAGAWKACTCIPCAGYFSTLLSHSLRRNAQRASENVVWPPTPNIGTYGGQGAFLDTGRSYAGTHDTGSCQKTILF